MDTKQYMIVDLEKRGDKQMFVTERVSSILGTRTDYGPFGFRHHHVYSITIRHVCFI